MKKPIPKKPPPKTSDEVWVAIIRLNKINEEYTMMGAVKLVRRITKEAIAKHLDCETKDIDVALTRLQSEGWVVKHFPTNEYRVKK